MRTCPCRSAPDPKVAHDGHTVHRRGADRVVARGGLRVLQMASQLGGRPTERGLRPPLARILCPLMAFALGAAHTTHCARAALQALPSPFPDVASAKFAGLKTPAGGLACAAMIESARLRRLRPQRPAPAGHLPRWSPPYDTVPPAEDRARRPDAALRPAVQVPGHVAVGRLRCSTWAARPNSMRCRQPCRSRMNRLERPLRRSQRSNATAQSSASTQARGRPSRYHFAMYLMQCQPRATNEATVAKPPTTMKPNRSQYMRRPLDVELRTKKKPVPGPATSPNTRPGFSSAGAVRSRGGAGKFGISR